MYTVQPILLCFVGVYLGWGLSHRELTQRWLGIIGGDVTDITKVPYQAAVFIDSKFHCGATVISKNFLLTACHCCTVDNYTVRVGSSDYEDGGTLLKITQHYIHPKCAQESIGVVYDICLLETSPDIEFGEKVKPLAISDETPQQNDLALIAGWGMTKEFGPLSYVLRSVYVPVTNKTFCADAYGDFILSNAFLCAGAEGKDACQGDSGGGLVWNNSVVGIVSFGFGCGEKNFPGVYTNVATAEVRKFIEDITGI